MGFVVASGAPGQGLAEGATGASACTPTLSCLCVMASFWWLGIVRLLRRPAKVRLGAARRAKVRVGGARRCTARRKVFDLAAGSAWATVRGLRNVLALARRGEVRVCLLNFFVFPTRGTKFSGAPGCASVVA